MGNKYTVEAGSGSDLYVQYGTEWFIVALWKFWNIKVDNDNVYWKRITMR